MPLTRPRPWTRRPRGTLAASARWQQILAPLGLGDEARAALRVDGTTWGFLCLHRSGPTPFAGDDLATLRRAAPHLGEALRRMASGVADPHDDVAPHGVVIVDEGRIAGLGGAAEQWLLEVTGRPLAPGDPAPLLLVSLVRRLAALESGQPVPPATIRLRTRSGALLTVQATRLVERDRRGAVALTITPASPEERTSLLVSVHGLTPAQRRVADLVLQGLTTRQVMQRLCISEHTVQDHLKAIFDKVGVRSRRELVAAIMSQRP